MPQVRQKIVPHVWFDGSAEAAARTYIELLPNSRIGHVARYAEAGRDQHGQPPGSVMSMEVMLDGYLLVLINGGPAFRPTPALSFFVMFEHATDLDGAWQRLADGGTIMMPLDRYDWSSRYGWLSDRHGVSWQLSLGTRADVGGAAVSPSLLFTRTMAGRAEEALRHYVSLFPGSSIEGVLRHDGSGVDAAGTVMHAQFQLAGQTFMAMDSAHAHDFSVSEATSLMVLCDTQEEVDHYWDALSAVPEAEACGWLKDRYGLSWQITPRALIDGLKDPDPGVVQRVMETFLPMKKLDVAELERARGDRN